MTSIGVIGSANIGETLGEAWRRAGHNVLYGSRSPQPHRTVAIADAIVDAEVATPGAAVPQLLAEHGQALDGRVVIDATNDISGERLHHADTYEDRAPGARFVRAFNTPASSCSPARRSAARWRTCSGAGRRTPASSS